MKKKMKRKSGGQTLVEYILIITLVAIASLVVLGIFSDRVRAIISGVATELGSDEAEDAYSERTSLETLQEINEGGLD
jgi:Flp pilus assembly pilin Flp